LGYSPTGNLHRAAPDLGPVKVAKRITPVTRFTTSAGFPDVITKQIRTAAKSSEAAARIIIDGGLTWPAPVGETNDKYFALDIAANAVDPTKDDSSLAAQDAATQTTTTVRVLRDAERAILALPPDKLPAMPTSKDRWLKEKKPDTK
jgi:hypothetical protein